MEGSKLWLNTKKFARIILKRTLWDYITTLPNLLNCPIHTTQILVIDRENRKILVLMTPETRSGYCVPQGICSHGSGLFERNKDVNWARENALVELREEAIEEEVDGQRFQPAFCYGEGRFKQFRCHLFILQVEPDDSFTLKETSEGRATWVDIDEAKNSLIKEFPVLVQVIEKCISGRSFDALKTQFPEIR